MLFRSRQKERQTGRKIENDRIPQEGKKLKISDRGPVVVVVDVAIDDESFVPRRGGRESQEVNSRRKNVLGELFTMG